MTLPAIVVYHVFVRGKRSPADKSTASTICAWFALTREDEFVGLFPWLMRWKSVRIVLSGKWAF